MLTHTNTVLCRALKVPIVAADLVSGRNREFQRIYAATELAISTMAAPAHSKGARSFRGQKILKPGHPESGCTFFIKKLTTFFIFSVVALKTQAANASDCFTVKIK